MTTATQQLPSNPALDFAQSILDETNNGLELIEILRDIAQDTDEVATTNDRIAATNILNDRAFGKSPKQITPSAGPIPEPAPEADANDVEPAPYSIRGAIRESPPTITHGETKSPRLVTQLGDSLNRSFGPPPEAKSPTPIQDENPVYPEPFDPYSIQKHILEITNNCLTLMTVLTDIYRAPDDDPKVKDSHRVRAGRMLVDRITAMYPTAVRSAADGLVLSGDYSEPGRRIQDDDDDEPFDEELWDEIIAELKQKEEAGIITPDPDAHIADAPINMPPEGFDETILAEEAAKFRAQNALRIERRKKWPEIEERRRKKLAQTYPSHSEGQPGDPPDI